MTRRRSFTLIELMIVITMIAVIIAISLPNFLEAKRQSNEASAVSSLKALLSAEYMFREKDRDGDGILNFATLAQLKASSLVHGTLADGSSNGYLFDVQASTVTPNERFFALANPSIQGDSGYRSFCTNHFGVVYYSMTATAVMNNTTCDIPAGFTPIGQ
ncbi:MAG: type II secretion system protein [Planctomycetota bacterium]